MDDQRRRDLAEAISRQGVTSPTRDLLNQRNPTKYGLLAGGLKAIHELGFATMLAPQAEGVLCSLWSPDHESDPVVSKWAEDDEESMLLALAEWFHLEVPK